MLEASKPVQVNHVGLRWLLTGLADIGSLKFLVGDYNPAQQSIASTT